VEARTAYAAPLLQAQPGAVKRRRRPAGQSRDRVRDSGAGRNL